MEAEAAAIPTTITSLTLNGDTTHAYVQEVPIESRTSLVDGRQEGVVITLNGNDTNVHAIMAQTLPKYVIIQSNLNNVYVHLYTENPDVPDALRYTGDYSFGLDTRFEVVPATTGTGLVHIRCLLNNKYLANFGTSNNWVTAMAVKPEENQSDRYCTLFQPIFVYSNNNRVLKLRHVNTGYYVRLFYGSGHYNHSLFLTYDKDEDVCTFIDWDDVVVLPDLIRIKGDNGNHLKASDGDGYMDFLQQADNSSMFDYEVSPSRDVGIRLKSTQFGTYWTDMDTSSWVMLKQQDDPTVHATNTVFLPTILDGNRIIMKCLKNGLFCNRYSHDGRLSGLATLSPYPDEWSSMEIEEPVVSRTISNVIYHLTDARLYNEKSVALITDDSSNRTPNPLTSEVDLKTAVTNTTNWSTSVEFKVGVKVTLTYGVPFIASGSLEVSAESTTSTDWGGTGEESVKVGSAKTITVEPMNRLKATLMATRLSYDIPFSYTQHDILKNGDKKPIERHDGVFTGNNGYGYKFEVAPLPLEPLPALD
ncbi:hypothetical protein MKX03_023906 [Papaver bracteatum]|nr:hypothetical protein MKX03_023906 [Papaver bracteatum]